MARPAMVRVAAIALLLALAGCGDYWVVGWGTYDDCWYDDYGNYWCDDGYYAGGVWTSGVERPVASHDVLRLLNEERAAVGLEPLALDPALAAIAYEEAVGMDLGSAAGGSAGGAGAVGDRLSAAGIEAPRSALLTSAGDARPEDVVGRWMADPAARAAVLDPGLRSAGVGVHATETGTWWAGLFVGG